MTSASSGRAWRMVTAELTMAFGYAEVILFLSASVRSVVERQVQFLREGFQRVCQQSHDLADLFARHDQGRAYHEVVTVGTSLHAAGIDDESALEGQVDKAHIRIQFARERDLRIRIGV